MSATGGPLDVPTPPSGLTAADLLQKLQMSRAAQHAAVALAASKASASASSETANPLMRAFALRPSSGGGGGGNSSSSSEGGDGEKGKRHSPLGFNSFMLEGLAGWRTELLSRRLRQAVVTEFCATGAWLADFSLSHTVVHGNWVERGGRGILFTLPGGPAQHTLILSHPPFSFLQPPSCTQAFLLLVDC